MKTLVIKIGTSLLTSDRGFDGRVLENLVKEIVRLKRESGTNVLIVSSGAVGCGMNVLGMKDRPKDLPLKQATAAVGQSRLMHYYEVLFETYGQGLHTAQVLLSGGDFDDRGRYLNIRNTIHALFDLNSIVPVINENDSVAVEELRFGDNDTLAARVASKIDAEILILLSDVDGLYDRNPNRHPDAKLIRQIETISAEIEALADDTLAQTSVGGMKTKLKAARMACAAGVYTVLANGRRENIIHDVLIGNAPCTRFGKASVALKHRKRWIAFGRKVRGTLVIDDGARAALIEKGRSLLPAGVMDVSGEFDAGSSVRITDSSGADIACGLTNYSSADMLRIKGCKTGDIQAILGYKAYDEAIHRDNLVIL
ncbi:MAG: glutamate 5-kinase [Candidatus Hydrogenedentota bacterium]